MNCHLDTICCADACRARCWLFFLRSWQLLTPNQNWIRERAREDFISGRAW